jgi:NAD(P)-dependent dehydrogenase (short-subunit alcohol dehydrogenase family)
LRELAEQAARDGADVLGVAGGDGSQAVVADVACRHSVAFVCVPAGTRNHVTLDLGLDVQDVAGALNAFSTALERPVDLGLGWERAFVNNASIGVYGGIVQAPGYRTAKLATTLALLPELFDPQAAPPDLHFHGADGPAHRSRRAPGLEQPVRRRSGRPPHRPPPNASPSTRPSPCFALSPDVLRP